MTATDTPIKSQNPQSVAELHSYAALQSKAEYESIKDLVDKFYIATSVNDRLALADSIGTLCAAADPCLMDNFIQNDNMQPEDRKLMLDYLVFEYGAMKAYKQLKTKIADNNKQYAIAATCFQDTFTNKYGMKGNSADSSDCCL